MKQKGVVCLLKSITKSHGEDQEDGSKRDTKGGTPSPTRGDRRPYRLPSSLADLTRGNLVRLNQEAQDYQIVHGGILKAVNQEDERPSASGRTIGVSLHPSPFPKHLFDEACEIQTIYHKLYVAVSHDPGWMREVLQDLIAADPLIETLWSAFEIARTYNSGETDRLSAGIFRSDYMVHAAHECGLQLKQVELNTISCAGAVHGQRAADMHRYLHATGKYQCLFDEGHPETKLDIPGGETVKGICAMLKTAHDTYVRLCSPDSLAKLSKICVIMVVQPKNFNIADERPIEYGLWSKHPPVPCFRVEWGKELLDLTSIASSGALHFQLPGSTDVYEVSVVYLRAGFEPSEYQGSTKGMGHNARVRLEMSNAIQCPNILTHLSGTKKVQQALCLPGALERFLCSSDATKLRQSFMRMYPLDSSDLGKMGKMLGTDPERARHYVLKPSREGGGHNVYRDDIPTFLEQLPQHRWVEYVLMEMIEPVVSSNLLVSSRGIWSGDVIAELGIWGGYVWRQQDNAVEMLVNEQIGWTVRSKNPNIDEVSVVKGYGCFDSVALIDDELVVG